MNWYDFVTVISATLIPSLTTSIIAIVKAVKNNGKCNDIAHDVTKIGHLTAGIEDSDLASTRIVNGKDHPRNGS